jgi:hypothetical protein
MDGHGEDGHLVSRFIKSNLSNLLETSLKEQGGLTDPSITDEVIEQALLLCFDRLAEELQASHIDS